MPGNWLPLTHVKQLRHGACLPACVRMVLLPWGDDVSEDQLAQLFGTEWYGTPANRLEYVLTQTGAQLNERGSLPFPRLTMSDPARLFIALYTAEDITSELAPALRERGFEAQSTAEAGLLQTDDARQLAYAAAHGLTLLTCNA
jgi:hypothetical protein